MTDEDNESTRGNEADSAVDDGFDYIIVGSGAGGAPLASRLARAGKRVLVIEAGSNHASQGATDPGNEISRVPLLHAASTEHPDLAWRFFVEHYQTVGGQLPDGIEPDPKRYEPPLDDEYADQRTGIFYPRAAGIGGCTIHNAMITIAGPNSDWDHLANFLGDESWCGTQMRAYFKKLENNAYMPAPDRSRQSPFRERWLEFKQNVRFLRGRRPDTTSGNHGFDGWLTTSLTDFRIGLKDKQLVRMLAAALWQSKLEGIDNAWFGSVAFSVGNSSNHWIPIIARHRPPARKESS